jgi:hypothetical protein
MGIGLAAAVGFRLFIPPLLTGIAAALGLVELPSSLEWLGSGVALTAFGTASLLELAAYGIPWLDNLLDTVATPLSVVAGTLLAAGFLADLPTALQWTLALIAGGGASAATQMATTAGRGASSATTGGLANPVVSMGEAFASVVTTALTLFLPVITASIVVGAVAVLLVKLSHVRRREPRMR